MLNRGRNIEKGRVITRRMFILAAAKILLFAGISSRLYNLQISDREKYEILSDKNFVIPEYKIDLLNKSKKIIQTIEYLDKFINSCITIFFLNFSSSKVSEILTWPEAASPKLSPGITAIFSVSKSS